MFECFWVDLINFGLLRIVLSSFGRFLMVVGSFNWLWVVLSCFGWIFFFYQGFLSRTLTTQLTGQQGKGGDHFLFHSTTSTGSRTFRHLFATLHLKWLSHIFNRTACIYQTATQWNLPLCRITIWLIDDVKLVSFWLLDDLILGY